jgi:hypothetical protein
MTRFHETTDVSTVPPTTTQVPFTQQEEMVADAVSAANTALSKDPTDFPLQPYQFDAMLSLSGLDSVLEAAIASLPNATTKAVVLAKLKRMATYDRSDPLFNQLGQIIGKTPADIDALWMQAKDL